MRNSEISQIHFVINTPSTHESRALHISAPTAAKALTTLESHSIVHEITGQQYRKIYAYREYLDILNDDTL